MENEIEEDESEDKKCDGSGGLTRVAYDKGVGKAAAKVMRTGLYEGIYNVHSEACYMLNTSANEIREDFDNRIASLAGCGSLEEQKINVEEFEKKDYPEMVKKLKARLEEYNIVGADTEPLLKLLEKYKKLFIARLSKGELPDTDYLQQQLDEFIEEFCADRTTDKTLSMAERFANLMGREEREEREGRED